MGVQRPALQFATVTLSEAQARSHAPQCAGLVSRFASQPSSASGAAGVSQSVKPPVQTGAQTPPTQLVDEALYSKQARPHPPQLAWSSFRLVSQPSSVSPGAGWTQSPKPELQLGWQTPAVQLTPEALVATHTCPQAPQLLASVATSLSQPSSGAGAVGWLQSS